MTKKEWNDCVNDLGKMKLTPKERKLREHNAKKYSPSSVVLTNSPRVNLANRNAGDDEIDFALVRNLLQTAMDKQEEQRRTDRAFEDELCQYNLRTPPVVQQQVKVTRTKILKPDIGTLEEGKELANVIYEITAADGGEDEKVQITDLTSLMKACTQLLRAQQKRELDRDVHMSKIQLQLKTIGDNQNDLSQQVQNLKRTIEELQVDNLQTTSTIVDVAQQVENVEQEMSVIKSQMLDLDCQLSAETISRNVKTLLFPPLPSTST